MEIKRLVRLIKETSIATINEARKKKSPQLDLFDQNLTSMSPDKEYEHHLTKHLNHMLDQHTNGITGDSIQMLPPSGNTIDDHAREDAKKIYDHYHSKGKIVGKMKAVHTGESVDRIAAAMGRSDKKGIESSADIVIQHPEHAKNPDENEHIGIQAKYATGTPSLRKLETKPMLGLLRRAIFTPKEQDKIKQKEELSNKTTKLSRIISSTISRRLGSAVTSFGRKTPEFKQQRLPIRQRLLRFYTERFNRLPLEKKKETMKKMTRSARTPGLDEITVRRFGSGKRQSEVYDHHGMWDNALNSFGHDIQARTGQGGGIRFFGMNSPTDAGQHLATYTPNTAINKKGDLRELGDVKETVGLKKHRVENR